MVFFLRPDGKKTHFFLSVLPSEEGIDLVETPLRWIEEFDPIWFG
jgi:hypothetical protein